MASEGGAGMQQAHSQPHIPRLSYRSSVTGTILHGPHDSADIVSIATTTAAAPTALISPPPTVYHPSRRHSKAAARAQSIASSDAVSLTSSTLSPETPTKLPTKRGSSLFGFLSVREPSQQAFLDYQESISKQTAARNGRVSAVGMPGVSSAKLPPSVPRVNSRWDGVPQTLKDKEKEKKDASRLPLMSRRRSSSNATAGGLKTQRSSSTLGSQRSNKKATSFSGNKAGNPSDPSVTKIDWEPYSLSNGNGSKDLATPSTDSGDSTSNPTLPEMTSFFPRDVPGPPKIPAYYRSKASAEIPSYIDVPQHSLSPSLTPVETSPVTPYPPSSPTHESTPFNLKPETISDDDFNDPGKLYQRFERVTLKSSGVNILAPPSTSKRRPNSFAVSAGKADQVRTVHGDDQPPSILKQNPSAKRSEVLARPPVSSYFPIIDTEPKGRRNETRNKHDPNWTVRNKDITPWEWDQPSMKVDAPRTSPTPTKQSGKASMRRKRSVFGR
ncbi:MAG: hypothetical protein FRX48_06348 [Lasallia pustulata]|nr:MAG: hypothetical protein FRX48_06348 [Lasallia pustulata]